MATGGINLTGLSSVISTLQEFGEEAAAVAGVEKLAQKVLAQAVKNAPVDTGFLRSTGEVRRPKEAARVVAFTAKYALKVHESTEIDYQNGDAKYLRRAVDKVVSEEASEIFVTELKKQLS